MNSRTTALSLFFLLSTTGAFAQDNTGDPDPAPAETQTDTESTSDTLPAREDPVEVSAPTAPDAPPAQPVARAKPTRYFKISFGPMFMATKGPVIGPIIAPTYGTDLGSVAIEVSPIDIGFDAAGPIGIRLAFLRTRAFYVARPDNADTPYFGGGFALVHNGYRLKRDGYQGGGIEFDVATGLQFGRGKYLRWSIEADLTLPAFTYKNESRTDQFWAPMMAIRIGVAYETKKGILSLLGELFE